MQTKGPENVKTRKPLIEADNCDSEREPYGYGIGKFTEDYSK